ncbi:hypothetical protein ACOALZ_00655 [Nocardiopsis algeriensis]|uniref:hypothetical protein n=1 Tax=Nocardiopsis algeriensis TaxID=1478215 RepID=UPI003B42DC2B
MASYLASPVPAAVRRSVADAPPWRRPRRAARPRPYTAHPAGHLASPALAKYQAALTHGGTVAA